MNKRSFILLLSLLAAASITPAYAAPTYACYGSLSATPPCVGQTGCDTTTYFPVDSYSTGMARFGATLNLAGWAIQKPVDQNSVTFFANMLLGTKIPAIIMVCIETEHKESFKFLQIQLQNVTISSDQQVDASKKKTESAESIFTMPDTFSVTVYPSGAGYTYDALTKTLTPNN